MPSGSFCELLGSMRWLNKNEKKKEMIAIKCARRMHSSRRGVKRVRQRQQRRIQVNCDDILNTCALCGVNSTGTFRIQTHTYSLFVRMTVLPPRTHTIHIRTSCCSSHFNCTVHVHVSTLPTPHRFL